MVIQFFTPGQSTVKIAQESVKIIQHTNAAMCCVSMSLNLKLLVPR